MSKKSLPRTFHGVEIVGPFDSRTVPANGSGLYGRISPMGNPVFSFYDAERRRWGLYSDDPRQARHHAVARKKFSKKDLRWFGFSRTSDQPKS